MVAVALAFDVCKRHRLSVIGQIGREKRAPSRGFALEIALAVIGDVPVAFGAAGERLTLEAPVHRGGLGQKISHGWMGSERIRQDKQAAPGTLRDAVILIAAMVVNRSVPFDEEEFVKSD